MAEPPRRRIFLSDGQDTYQVLNIAQALDASFYVSCPNFERSKWVEIVNAGGAPFVNVAAPRGDGKLSVHGSGYAGIRAHDAVGHDVVVRGNILREAGEPKSLRPRHLLSVLPEQPQHKPRSPAGARASDYILNSKQRPMAPVALLLFAIPAVAGLQVAFSISFHDEEMGVPPDISYGLATFPLHGILWIAYTTKHMVHWPTSTHFCHYDGFTVPIFLGGGPSEWRFIATDPRYALEANRLTIELSAVGPDQPR